MRQQTYEAVNQINEKYHGYIRTVDLLREGFTNRQIANLQSEGYLEKIANGSFWLSRAGREKPWDYKPVEVGIVNENAVIVAESACYYQGFIEIEPPALSIATRRSDRHKMQFPFAVTRHYFAEDTFDAEKKTVKTSFGNYQIYDIDRSVCDCIRFQESMDGHIFTLIIEKYQKEHAEKNRINRMMAYARSMKFEEKARRIL
ncbi:MAG: hypothetical protein PHE02_02080 [Lachnospiraceae bacterium]|nr:hypothetical protein [Lachnospiraceae bacterium]